VGHEQTTKRLMELSQLIEKEQNAERFSALIAELTQLLDTMDGSRGHANAIPTPAIRSRFRT
jgi:hypothetical protein